MSYKRLVQTIRGSFYEALIVLAALSIAFISFEAAISRAVDTSQFTVTQSIIAEVSFTTDANDVSMSPSIAGVTGGQATGSSQFVVTTNNATGYSVTIGFASSSGMARNGSNGADTIQFYTPAGTTSPTINFDIGGAGSPGEFGYTVDSSSTYLVADQFRGNGTYCNIGASGVDSVDECWLGATSTDATQIINSTSSTPASGSTSTVKFVVEVPNSPSPTLPTGDYVATVTLTAAANP